MKVYTGNEDYLIWRCGFRASYKQCEAFNENRRTIVFGGE